METATTARQPRKPTQAVVGILRRGYTIHQGSDPDMVIKSGKNGLEEISLNAKTARLYLHMFDNYEEVAEAFGIPINKPAKSMAEQVQESINLSRSMNPGQGGMTPDEVSQLVSKTLAPLVSENKQLKERLEVLEQLVSEQPDPEPAAKKK